MIFLLSLRHDTVPARVVHILELDVRVQVVPVLAVVHSHLEGDIQVTYTLASSCNSGSYLAVSAIRYNHLNVKLTI